MRMRIYMEKRMKMQENGLFRALIMNGSYRNVTYFSHGYTFWWRKILSVCLCYMQHILMTVESGAVI